MGFSMKFSARLLIILFFSRVCVFLIFNIVSVARKFIV